MPVMGLEELAQVLAKGALEVREVNEPVGLSHPHEAAAFIESSAGHQAMDVKGSVLEL